MGQGTFVTPTKPLRSTTNPRPLRLGLDVPLLLVIITLLVFGLMMVYSASWNSVDTGYTFRRQILWVGLGVLVAAFLAWFDYHWMKRFLIPMVLVTLGLLAAVLVVNNVRFNAARSLFEGSLQPSELAKIVTIIYLSFWLYNKRDQLGDIHLGLIPMAAILGIMGGLIVSQPDLSATFTIFILGGFLFFLAGGDWKQIILLLIIALVCGFILVKIVPTGMTRLTSYIDGLRDPTQASYHVRRSLEAVVKGGWFGVGIGKSTTKFIGLPVPATDSIFAVIAEETGLMGVLFVVALYMLLLWRGLIIAKNAKDQLGSLLAAALTLWLITEALINMTVIVGLIPVSGNALPFISAGGSNMMVSMAAIGIIMNVARTSMQRDAEEGRSFSAVVDLRRRDRGGRVPRPNRYATPQ